jgi:hypothetical protein
MGRPEIGWGGAILFPVAIDIGDMDGQQGDGKQGDCGATSRRKKGDDNLDFRSSAGPLVSSS